MAITITINGTVTLDESDGLQTSGVSTTTEDNNDSDVLISSLPTTFTDEIGATLLGTAIGAAHSASNFIDIDPDSSITTLKFLDSTGGALDGDATTLKTLDGNTIFLYYDASNPDVVYGREGTGNVASATGDIVFALYLDKNAATGTASVWSVLFQPIAHLAGR